MSRPSETLERILADAVEIPSVVERRAFVDQACGADATLRARVEELVANHFRAGGFLESPAAVLETAASPPTDEHVTQRIGPYTLREPLGEGGMGLVYVAEQQHPVRRLVALKVIKPGMDSKQVVARFEAERQALALMDHPNIAKVLDAGTTDDGRPFFVMELIRGLPITQYCDQARLTVRQRLALFAQVCRAVQHAHTKAVIHRDLKPGNVLVTSHDGVPVPVVIDFGVAKALGGQLTDHTIYTGFHAMVGTPLYMSPEQVEFNQMGVDTRSDVYALGALLYELLTGTTPIDRERLKTAGYDEFRRILREEEPPRPSTRLSTVAAVHTTASARRCADAGTLTRTLHGELDWIVLKALEKDRNRRYQSAGDFAADVDRYLANEPVAAHPPSAWYRLKKLIRRHRVKVGIAAVTLTAAVIATGSVVKLVVDQQHHESVLWGQVDAALNEAAEHFARRRLPEANASVRRAEELVAGQPATSTVARVRRWRRDLDMVARLEDIRLETAETKNDQVDDRAADRAYAEAFRDYGVEVDGVAPEAVGEAIRARPVARELAVALDSWAGHRKAARDPNDGGWRHLLAVARIADPDPWRVQLRDAQEAGDKATLLPLVDAVGVREQPPETQCALGAALESFEDFDTAVKVLRQAQRNYPADFWVNYQLGRLHQRTQNVDWMHAIRYLTAATALRPNSAVARARLALALLATNEKQGAARQAAEDALRLDPNSAFAYQALGTVFRKAGKFDRAVDAYREAIRLRPGFTNALTSLGNTLADMGRFDDACEAFREASRTDPQSGLRLYNLALALKQKGDLDTAAAAIREVIRLTPVPGDNAYNTLGAILIAQKKWTEAEDVFRQALARHPNSAVLHGNLGVALLRQNRPRDAVPEIRETIRLDPANYSARFNLCLTQIGIGEDATDDLRSFEQAVRGEIREEAVIEGGFCLAQAYQLAGKNTTARTWFDQTAARLDKSDRRTAKLTALREKTEKAINSKEKAGDERKPR